MIFNFDALCKNFDVVHDISAMSGYKDTEDCSSISKILSISGTICHIWSGWAHRYTGSPGPAAGSSLLVLDRLDGLYSWVTVLTPISCWSSAAFCCCSGPALVWTAGQLR
jgi:hypothetical protein